MNTVITVALAGHRISQRTTGNVEDFNRGLVALYDAGVPLRRLNRYQWLVDFDGENYEARLEQRRAWMALFPPETFR